MKLAPMQSHKEFRLVIKVRNNRLIKAREQLGCTSGLQFTKLIGMQPSLYCQYEAISINPINEKTGKWRDSAQKIADFHGLSPDYFWPEAVRSMKVVAKTLEMSSNEANALSESFRQMAQLEDNSKGRQLRKLINSELDDREKQVIEARFFKEKTLKAVGDEVQSLALDAEDGDGVHQERVRAIECSALMKLRKAMSRDSKETEAEDDLARLPGKKQHLLEEFERLAAEFNALSQKLESLKESRDAYGGVQYRKYWDVRSRLYAVEGRSKWILGEVELIDARITACRRILA